MFDAETVRSKLVLSSHILTQNWLRQGQEKSGTMGSKGPGISG